ncbi:unnamed protein product, partial [Rotaria socialis]
DFLELCCNPIDELHDLSSIDLDSVVGVGVNINLFRFIANELLFSFGSSSSFIFNWDNVI